MRQTSMFDDFRDKIEKWCKEGKSVAWMITQFPEGYTYDALRCYLVRNNLIEVVNENRPICDECEYCKIFKNIAGEINSVNNRICSKSWRLIQYNVIKSPKWCERGQ